MESSRATKRFCIPGLLKLAILKSLLAFGVHVKLWMNPRCSGIVEGKLRNGSVSNIFAITINIGDKDLHPKRDSR
jgi:hypothetical protein